MSRTPRHPNPAEKQPDRPASSPLGYLEKQRGEQVARLIVAKARWIGEQLARPATPAWTADKRKKALKLAKELQPLCHQGAPGLLASVIDAVIARWTREAAARSRGRPISDAGNFALFMLWWAARDLGARDEKQLTATELIAAAAIAELPDIGWQEREKLLDSWRKLWKAYLPQRPDDLAAEGRKLLAEEKLRDQRIMAELLRQGGHGVPSAASGDNSQETGRILSTGKKS